jgi:DNA-binding NarL/FixJ family response regulator
MFNSRALGHTEPGKGSGSSVITLLVVDDQPSVRRGLRMRLALEPDLKTLGEASNGLEALAAVRSLKPDVVVMDVDMPHMDGIAATATLAEVAPCTAVVILSIHDDEATRQRARAAGAAAFVAKQAGDLALLEAIHTAAKRPAA